METEIPKKEEETIVEEGFEIHSVESDMQKIGIDAKKQESNEEQPAAEVEPQKEEAEEKKPKKSRAQRKIERQNRELKEKDKKIAELESKPVAKEETPEINVDDYENYDDYVEALASKEEEIKEEPQKEEPKLEEDSQVKDLFDDGNEDYEDFEEKVRAKDLVISEDLLNEILEAESPSEVAYYLANNKELSEKLSNMTPREIAKEVTKIESKLETKPQKSVQVSKAPEPITPLEGNSSKKKSLNDDDLSFEDHEALLNSRANVTPGGFL